MLLAIILQVIIPLLLFISFASGSNSVLNMMARAVIVVCYLLGVRATAQWLLIPWYGFYLYLGILGLVALYVMFTRKYVPFAPRRRTLMTLQIEVAIALVMINFNIYLLVGGTPNETYIVDLKSPIVGRSVYVMHGGVNSFLNGHMITPSNNQLRAPGNIYGVDLLVVNDHGRITDSLFPRNSQDYVGYGHIVYSPCSGTVSRVSADYSDQALNEETRQILIECSGYEVQLSHLQMTNLIVEQGEKVDAGQLLGRLGAVVEGEAPYLHMHVQRRSEQSSGEVLIEPVQVSLEGNFLSRGNIVP